MHEIHTVDTVDKKNSLPAREIVAASDWKICCCFKALGLFF